MTWKFKRRSFDLTHRGIIMGILNVTPDSFSDGGSFLDPEKAVAHALRMEREGAEIIDVGGESTRPGAEAVDAEQELMRVIPVIRALRARSEVVVSIDTSKAVVAEEAVRAGADIINDVTALLGDSRMAEIAARSEAGVVLMHMQGEPRTMQQNPRYEDVTAEVTEFLRQRVSAAIGYGMAVERIAIDPGIGFGKSPSTTVPLIPWHARRTWPAHPGGRLPEVVLALAGQCFHNLGQILARGRADKLLPREGRKDLPRDPRTQTALRCLANDGSNLRERLMLEAIAKFVVQYWRIPVEIGILAA